MRDHRGPVVVAVAGLLVLSGCLVGFIPGEGSDAGDGVDGDLEIHHIDVGQADSTLVITPEGETVLIDTGGWQNDGEDVIDYLEREGIDRIDHLVTTHGHADHIGGHPAVIEHFEERGDGIGAIYDPGVAHTSATYENYLDAIEEHDVELFEVVEGDALPLEDESVNATVLNPPDHGDGDIDAYSTVLRFEYESFTYLTTGDIEERTERRLVEEHGDELAADVYQAGHHGSSTSSSEPFLDAVRPEVTVISSALDSQYGHPHDEVLESLNDRDIETYWTGVHGDVVIETDGEEIAVTPAEDGPTDPGVLLERKHEEQSEAVGVPGTASTDRSPGTLERSPSAVERPSAGQSSPVLEQSSTTRPDRALEGSQAPVSVPVVDSAARPTTTP